MTRPATWEDYQARVGRAIQYLERHLDGDVSLPDLAAVANFSPCHFHRVFRAVTGESVAEQVRRLRLARAALRLRHSERLIVDIALEAGYQTHESFTRAFEAAFEVSPSGYRSKSNSAPLPEIAARVERIGPLHVVQLRHLGPYSDVGQTFQRLATWVGAHRLFGPWTQGLGIIYDDPEVTPPEFLRYDAAFTVLAGTAGEGEVEAREMAAREYATTIHQGPYDRLNLTYAALIRWSAGRGEGEISDAPAIEFYLNQPGLTAPEALLTKVCLPLSRVN